MKRNRLGVAFVIRVRDVDGGEPVEFYAAKNEIALEIQHSTARRPGSCPGCGLASETQMAEISSQRISRMNYECPGQSAER
jgi:hypothetical protein